MGSYSENSETCSENASLCVIEGGEVSLVPLPFGWELERDLILLLYEERDPAVRDAICCVLRRIEERRRNEGQS